MFTMFTMFKCFNVQKHEGVVESMSTMHDGKSRIMIFHFSDRFGNPEHRIDEIDTVADGDACRRNNRLDHIYAKCSEKEMLNTMRQMVCIRITPTKFNG